MKMQVLRTGSNFWKFKGKLCENVRFLSYFHVCGKSSLMYKSLGQLLDEGAQKYGDRTAYVSSYQNQRVSFLEAQKKAEELAAGILARGVEKGDRVGLWAPNSMEWYITSFALAKCGLISVYLNPLYQSLEIEHCLNAVGVKMLIMSDVFKSQNFPEILGRVVPELAQSEPGKIKSKKIPTLESVVCISDKDIPGTIPFQLVAEGATENSRKKLKEIEKVISPDDPCNIQFTSGTTGSPKGVTLSHFHVGNNGFLTSQRIQLSEKHHTVCLLGPLFHAMGSVIAILNSLLGGATLVVPERTFSPTSAAKEIIDEKCTVLLGTPTMYVDLIKVMEEKGLKANAEMALCGGAFAPPQLATDICSKLNVKNFVAVYGLTETGPVCFLSKPTDTHEQRANTVGYLMENMEVKVVDDKGLIVPWDTPGELWVRGYNVMRAYWGEEKKTKDTITPEHWLKTGDQFALSKDGYGRIVGRIKDMIIRGGENIFPADIEGFLSTHPDILDVQIVGIPDKRLGERVCACIRLKPNSKATDKDFKQFCEGKIANFKIPEFFYFADTFPRTPSEKVQKYKLRAQAMEHLGITEEK